MGPGWCQAGCPQSPGPLSLLPRGGGSLLFWAPRLPNGHLLLVPAVGFLREGVSISLHHGWVQIRPPAFRASRPSRGRQSPGKGQEVAPAPAFRPWASWSPFLPPCSWVSPCPGRSWRGGVSPEPRTWTGSSVSLGLSTWLPMPRPPDSGAPGRSFLRHFLPPGLRVNH